ncbi:hypothetical protein TELCIR_07558 [Teladorsagia circumcincta]|uniref:Uncharacterized protein n=1 Tax=Teladorsagia circumcincta TaxID=45464 RepID=A0A2G9UKB5_TELCI|nr:hypothetical protein TELCIR_07558 [Teladorsagia circumcincta]
MHVALQKKIRPGLNVQPYMGKNQMDLYEPLGDQRNVVDAPKTKEEPMMPPMEKAKPRKKESVKPLRSGDDIDLVSDTGPDLPKKPCKLGANTRCVQEDAASANKLKSCSP